MKFASCWCAILAPAVAQAAAFLSALPEPTVFAPALDYWSPAPTQAPQLLAFHLFRRQDSANTCGFLSGSSESAITCYASNAACVTNSYYGVQGCCDSSNLSDCVLPTTCIASTAMSTACTDMACSTNAAIAKCTSSGQGECTQILVVYPKTTMTQNGCAASKGTMTIQRTWGTTSSVEAPKTVTVTAPAASTPTTTSSSSEKTTSSSNLGAIVGGTVGGCLFLSLLVLGIFMCYRRRKNQRNSVQPGPRPVAHYHQPSMTEYNPVPFQRPESWSEEDYKLWQRHQLFQEQRPSTDFHKPTAQMPNYPGMKNQNILEADGMERPVEAPT